MRQKAAVDRIAYYLRKTRQYVQQDPFINKERRQRRHKRLLSYKEGVNRKCREYLEQGAN